MSRLSVAVVDNYDSFTWNLVQLLAALGARPHVYRNDEVEVAALARHDALVISPGPGAPDSAGVSLAAIGELSEQVPLLGVCLGHQCVGQAFGGRVRRDEPVHGKTSLIRHDGRALFRGLPEPMTATRYHSLVVESSSIPAALEVTAWTDDGVVMGLRHRERRCFGVQFHPESVLTPDGRDLLRNFLELAS